MTELLFCTQSNKNIEDITSMKKNMSIECFFSVDGLDQAAQPSDSVLQLITGANWRLDT